MNVAVLGKKRIDPLSLVRGQIVGDHMNLLTARLVHDDVSEKRHELGRGVALGSLAQHLTGLGIESRVQRQGAVAEILEAMTLGATRRQRQHRIEAIQRLNGRLLIDTEHCRVRRRIEVETNDVRGLGLELGVIRCQIASNRCGCRPCFAQTRDTIMCDTPNA